MRGGIGRGGVMGQAKQRRDKLGVTDERTDTEARAALLEELRRIKWQQTDLVVGMKRELAPHHRKPLEDLLAELDASPLARCMTTAKRIKALRAVLEVVGSVEL